MKEVSPAYRPIRRGLDAVEAEIANRTTGRFSVLLRGKRLRPAMLLLAAGATGERPDRDAVLAAAIVEIVHTASLIHDDVIDSALRRRDGAALHRVIGVKPAVIFADLLFVQGLAALEELHTPGLVHLLVREVRTMCEGQWLEARIGAGASCSQKQYFDIINKKTASLFAFCGRTGGLLGKAASAELAALEEFGRQFGLAYQLLDDAEDLEDERPGAIQRALARRGGVKYCRDAAGDAAFAARRALKHVPPRVAGGLGRLLSSVMEDGK
ncbi:polyprenyl synthetase family protein [candidate division WOR-3 bacterium]|uniref:Polyprenyl synthetase family protein n=1 Tax=candidate division WOR-3 bacterium TaxID=2052148 RepID=A0A938BT78_UNCW3|nr:polyprenyl synthetase family protein [candidate division WOR-3 bacterium]